MKNLNKVLFIGIGGGNDVFSTVFAIKCLSRIGWKWDRCSIAGVLSPFHEYGNITNLIFPGVFAINPWSKRFVKNNRERTEIPFIDRKVYQMSVEESSLGIDEVYGLSLAEGARGVTESFKSLANTFDLFVLVDLGGDCFYSGKNDRHVLSPMFDSMVVKGFVDSGVPGVLFEAGPGTDGEIEPESLRVSLDIARAEKHPIEDEDIDRLERMFRKWIQPFRPGRTVPMTIEAYRSKEKFIKIEYRARTHFGKERAYAYFTQTLETVLSRSFYLIEPKNIINPFLVPCDSPLDWFFKTQTGKFRTNCEANMEFFPEESGLTLLLTPSPLLSDEDRQKMLNYGAAGLLGKLCDSAIIFPQDWTKINRYLASGLEYKPEKTVFLRLSVKK